MLLFRQMLEEIRQQNRRCVDFCTLSRQGLQVLECIQYSKGSLALGLTDLYGEATVT